MSQEIIKEYKNVYLQNIKYFYKIKINDNSLDFISKKNPQKNLSIPFNFIGKIKNMESVSPQTKFQKRFLVLIFIMFSFGSVYIGNMSIFMITILFIGLIYLGINLLKHKVRLNIFNEGNNNIEILYLVFKTDKDKNDFVKSFKEVHGNLSQELNIQSEYFSKNLNVMVGKIKNVLSIKKDNNE